ncbi:MAG: hypothetical protein EPO40_21500 [Myxococcaceae bacterium]|nr:MAG: hypothetical protein EPO40_21500 [Myxococcaceae bacterium]
MKETMPLGRLTRWLRSVGRPRLADHVRALHHVHSFERHFIATVLPTRRAARSRLPPHIFEQAVAAGVLVPLPRRCRPIISAPLKAVPDRKDPSVGRLILPACRLNDSCVPPDPCPIPHLPHMIARILENDYIVTADLRSWFFSFSIGRDVADKYFATRGPDGRFYAHVRGAMGWCAMPYIACSVAEAIVQAAARSHFAFAWIDDLSIATRSEAAAIVASRRLERLARFLGAELRDLSAPSRSAVIVGVQVDLAVKAWRLAPQWATKFSEFWASIADEARVPARVAWRAAGYIAWATYALQLPLALTAAGSRMAMETLSEEPTALVDFRAISRAFGQLASVIRANPWRRMAAPPTRTLVTDASPFGLGALVDGRQLGVPIRHLEHINALEVAAIAFAIRRSGARSQTVDVIVDNRVVFYCVPRWRSLGAGQLHNRICELMRLCMRRKISLRMGWIPTEVMAACGADAASRGSRITSTDVSSCSEHAEWQSAALVEPLLSLTF